MAVAVGEAVGVEGAGMAEEGEVVAGVAAGVVVGAGGGGEVG